MAAKTNFREGRNARNKYESIFEGEHILINDLRTRKEIVERPISRYINKEIIGYPTSVEFHITEVAHVTNLTSLHKIWDSEGFKGHNENQFSWWSQKINNCDIQEAEERYLERLFPNRSKEAKSAQQPVLKQFTTSPLFNNEISRYGNFRFTFPLSELMETYKKQKCEGEEPVLRVYGTKIFRQEIEYVVLVHSPQFNEKFKNFPLLTSSPIVDYDGHRIIWKAQAICETHNLELDLQLGDILVAKPMFYQFYVWDQVSFAFHTNEVLIFPKTKLKASLRCCEHDSKIDLSLGKNCSSVKDAERVAESLNDGEKEEHKSEEIKLEKD
ncbi:uncharacterized protein LOC130222353 [Danio aesculapii]|uniref:uncharacterized protein LOC130222353 n=1 Tax=Danio aesculapii TaxID=1142201 RepID=UPI0024BFBF75|nr:uncharacterized protein LOC130222353 [Danio aesculapii]